MGISTVGDILPLPRKPEPCVYLQLPPTYRPFHDPVRHPCPIFLRHGYCAKYRHDRVVSYFSEGALTVNDFSLRHSALSGVLGHVLLVFRIRTHRKFGSSTNKVTTMKQMLFLIICFLPFSTASFAQTSETFDIATFRPPANWNKQATQNSVQLSTEDKASGAFCLITLFKSLPGTNKSAEDFDSAWKTVVKGMVNTSTAPQMASPEANDGWEILSGYAPFEKDGSKGIAMLVTASGFGKMVNAFILTNTQAYQQNISDFLDSIRLKKPDAAIVPALAVVSAPSAFANGYGYATTKFDDGWTSTVQEDWIQVTKGNAKVLIHYPNKSADTYNSVLLEGLRNAWNVLAAPKYSSVSNFQYRPTGSWESIEFAETSAIEIATGKSVFVVLFKKHFNNGSGKYIEFIFPDKTSYEQEFGVYDTSSFGGSDESWNKMANMANYNKFGVMAADLKGKWTNDYFNSLSYVNVYTGASAGMDTHASKENFSFGEGNTYQWDLGVASGMVGNIKFQGVKSSGRVSVPNLWQVTFSSIEGKPRTYKAQFSCIKGARILWLDGTAYGKVQ